MEIYLLVIAVFLGVLSVAGICALGTALVKFGLEDRAAIITAVQDLQRSTLEKLLVMSSQLNAIQIADHKNVLGVTVRAMDLDAEQLAALDRSKAEAMDAVSS